MQPLSNVACRSMVWYGLGAWTLGVFACRWNILGCPDMFVKMRCLLSSPSSSLTMLTWGTRFQEWDIQGSLSVPSVLFSICLLDYICSLFVALCQHWGLLLVFSPTSILAHCVIKPWRQLTPSLLMGRITLVLLFLYLNILREESVWMIWEIYGCLSGDCLCECLLCLTYSDMISFDFS